MNSTAHLEHSRNQNTPSPDAIRAFLDIAANAECFIAALGEAERQFASLPSDDFFLQKTSGLREPITAYLEGYQNEGEFVGRAIAVSLPGTLNALLPGVAAMSSMLFMWGHESVGIALVGSDGLGVVFKRTSHEDVVCRQVIQIQGPVQ